MGMSRRASELGAAHGLQDCDIAITGHTTNKWLEDNRELRVELYSSVPILQTKERI